MKEIFLCRDGIPETEVFPNVEASEASSDVRRAVRAADGGIRETVVEEIRLEEVEEDGCGVVRGAS